MTNSDDASQRSRVNISVERQIFVVPLLRVENVMKLLVCSRSTAYEHMNHALGRTERPGRLLRVPLDVFESYIANELRLAGPRPQQTPLPPPTIARRAVEPGGGRSSSTGAPMIRVARPPRPRR
jgi:hypothetical protein